MKIKFVIEADTPVSELFKLLNIMTWAFIYTLYFEYGLSYFCLSK